MRKRWITGAMAGLLLAVVGSGCIMVIGVERPIKTLGKDAHLVEIDDELYIVNVEKQTVHKVDEDELENDD